MDLVRDFEHYRESSISDRFFKHTHVQSLILKLDKDIFRVEDAGRSVHGRTIRLVTAGVGPTRVFLWSQMHGDEGTATMALMDLFNFLGPKNQANDLRNSILNNCTLYILPMVNPDGAEMFTRRNALGIDINRDFHRQQTPEGILLRRLRDEIDPEFGFNLHDQSTLWSAGKSANPATISLLAPAYDQELSINSNRQKAMQVIACMHRDIEKVLPGHTGRFDDEFEPRAFGDNFQKAGTATILVESGGYRNDPEKQHIRKITFAAILSGLSCIARNTYAQENTGGYFAIPPNEKRHYHIVLRNCLLNFNGTSYRADIGLTAIEEINEDLRSVKYTYQVEDTGDLGGYFGYDDLDAENYKLILTQPLECLKPADLIVLDGHETILSIEQGRLTGKNFQAT